MDQLKPVRPVTVFESVFDQLSALLAGDAFSPGDRLPSERELAEQLQVSRPSVREALKALRVLGEIEVRGRSTYVRREQGFRSAGAPSISLPMAEVELFAIQEFREAVEPKIAALAAERATPADIADLGRVIERLQRVSDEDSAALPEVDRQFHATLARASGNRLLVEAQAQIYEHARRQPRLQAALTAAETGSRARRLDTYRRIADAVGDRDPQRARRLVQVYLAQVHADVMAGTLAREHAPPGDGGI